MEQKVFKNLSNNYKKYLDNIAIILDTFDINNTYKFSELNKFYNDVNNINTELLIVEKDIDNLINYYEKCDKNEITIKLKSLLKKRNEQIIRNLLKSSIYQDYLEKLYLEKSKKISKAKIDEALLEIIKKYAMSWRCCWSFLRIDDNGNIKGMELFDISDIEYFNEIIKN
jgi:hypothetical protein